MQISVPISGANVVSEGEGPSRDGAPQTPAQRKSLHTVRMSSTIAQPEYRPEWKENGQLKWVPAEPAQEPIVDEPAADTHIMGNSNGATSPHAGADAGQPFDTLHREISELKQTIQTMAQGLSPQPQQPQAPQPPDPAQFDFYDPHQVAEFHKLNNAYIQATVHQSVQAALDPHRDAMQSAEYTRQYNSVLADYGNDPNFKPFMDKALQMVAKSNGRFSIPDAYEWVSASQITSPLQTAAPQQGVKPAQRTLTAQEAAQKAAQAHSLPPRNGVSGAAESALPTSLMNVGALGRIMLHNQQTGRARPL